MAAFRAGTRRKNYAFAKRDAVDADIEKTAEKKPVNKDESDRKRHETLRIEYKEKIFHFSSLNQQKSRNFQHNRKNVNILPPLQPDLCRNFEISNIEISTAPNLGRNIDITTAAKEIYFFSLFL